MTKALLDERLGEWEEGWQERREDTPPEKLCSDRPTLTEELRRRIEGLKAFDALASKRNPPEPTAALIQSHLEKLTWYAGGGVGVLYKANNTAFRRQEALKFLQQCYADHPDNRDRFRTEAEITAQLEHPGIVPIYGMGQDEAGNTCYAMRFIHGLAMDKAIAAFHEANAQGLDQSGRASQDSRVCSENCTGIVTIQVCLTTSANGLSGTFCFGSTGCARRSLMRM